MPWYWDSKGLSHTSRVQQAYQVANWVEQILRLSDARCVQCGDASDRRSCCADKIELGGFVVSTLMFGTSASGVCMGGTSAGIWHDCSISPLDSR